MEKRRDFEQLMPPYGLAIISSYLKDNDVEIEVLDAKAHQMVRKEILNYIEKKKPDIIGFTCMTPEFSLISSLLPSIKEMIPKIKVVLGGPHPTLAPLSILKQNLNIDIVVIGEGEYTSLEMVKALENGKSLKNIKGLGFRNNNKITINKPRELIQNLDSLPYADWDSLPVNKYFAHVSSRKNYVKFLVTRGCPYSCTFCAAPLIMGKKLRKRSPKNIVGELIHLYDEHKVREVGFSDSTLNIDNKWLRELCIELIEMNKERPIIWECNVRADTTDEKTIKIMKEAGCVLVTMGIESGNQKMLYSMKKGETLDQFRRAVSIFNKQKMPVLSSFILGMPGETTETINDTLNFAKELNLFNAGFNLAMPFPRTEFCEQAIKEGWVLNDSIMANMSPSIVSYVPKEMTKEQLRMAYKNVNKKYHLRLSHLLKIAASMKSFTNLKIHLWGGLRIIKKTGGRLKT